MKDNIIFGSMAGAIGGAVRMIFSYTMFLLGVSPMASVHLAACFVVKDIIHLSVGGAIWAIVTHLVVAALYGTLLTYFFIYFGEKVLGSKGHRVRGPFLSDCP